MERRIFLKMDTVRIWIETKDFSPSFRIPGLEAEDTEKKHEVRGYDESVRHLATFLHQDDRTLDVSVGFVL